MADQKTGTLFYPFKASICACVPRRRQCCIKRIGFLKRKKLGPYFIHLRLPSVHVCPGEDNVALKE
jgi:hypothetical protein